VGISSHVSVASDTDCSVMQLLDALADESSPIQLDNDIMVAALRMCAKTGVISQCPEHTCCECISVNHTALDLSMRYICVPNVCLAVMTWTGSCRLHCVHPLWPLASDAVFAKC